MNKNIYLNCSYIPPELFAAAGLNPVRLWPAEINNYGEKLLPEDICPYIKALLPVLSEKKRIIMANSCDGMRRLYDILADKSYFLEVPRKSGEDEVDYYYKQLLNLLHYLKIDYDSLYKQKLKKTIIRYNKKRELLNLLKNDHVWSKFLRGIKIYTNTISADLETLMQEAKDYSIDEDNPVVLVTGTCLLDGQIIDLIEKNNFNIGAIDSCFGERSYNINIKINEKEDDPLKELARVYLHKPACPRCMYAERRLTEISTYVRTAGVNGIIYFIPKFCDLAAYDFKLIKDWSKTNNIPVLHLEGEYRAAQSGQLNTRIAAFRESLII